MQVGIVQFTERLSRTKRQRNLLSFLSLDICLLLPSESLFPVIGPLDLAWIITQACLIVQPIDGRSWDFLTSIIMGANSYSNSLSLSFSLSPSFLPPSCLPPSIHNIQVSLLLKVYVMPLCFSDRPTLLPVLPTKIKEDFSFYEKRTQKWCAILVLAWTVRGTVCMWVSESATKLCTWGHTLSTSASGHQSFEISVSISALSQFVLCVH